MARPTGNMPALTGMRGIGAVWVMLFHLTYSSKLFVLRSGYLGVDLFFILSGVVLSHVYAKDDLLRLGNYLSFLRNRIARIYPLHVITLLALVVLIAIVPHFYEQWPDHEARFNGSTFIASVLLIQNWAHWIPDAWNVPAWSLSAEWFGYLCFPLILFAASFVSRGRSGVIAVFSLLSFLAFCFIWKGIDGLSAIGTPGMLRMLCELSAGCILYRIAVLADRSNEILLISVAIALLVLSLTVTDYAAPFAFVVFVFLSMDSGTRVAKWLSVGPLVFLGEISYSLYLWHWMGIELLDKKFADSPWILWMKCGYIPVIIVVAAISRQCLEEPLRKWGRKRKKAAPALTGAA